MYSTRVLIITNRKELSVKYKKIIDSLNQEAIITKDLGCALSVIQEKHVEFIIISDTIKENLSDFVKKIRILTYDFRPIIIAISKSSDLQDKLKVLESGADDVLGEEISKQEFQMRFRAHLRRYIESSINSTTRLFDKKVTQKALQKSLEYDDSAYLLIKIRGLEQYRKTHGEIAGEKVIQTIGAIINSTLSNNDFTGHIKEDELILITNTMQAEKICAFLVFAFDNILNKFYSNDEFENNFVIQSGDNILESKDYLMRLNVTAVEKAPNENDYKNIINNLNNLLRLCENSKNSTYVIDRIKLKGEVKQQAKKNKVLIVECDSALSYLLKNVLEMNNIEVESIFNLEEFDNKYSNFNPDVVILDWGCEEVSKSLDIAQKISKDDIKLIFSSSYLNKKEILKSGADLYLPKPYEIEDMLNWVKKYLEN